ncbi:type IV toxin-antitoxin system AbiEi family antitoxin [Isoptericola croceus]|uniref:type IV toxin-antitoxin system AbiEi family antitoxin n=1 Tax=Isoptericola croceus TaxID=3031406 RepID=UPI0023F69E6A|nr:type IV toxin-antitoxin system AbiEi family antitoxin [Isoptericola croceus]
MTAELHVASIRRISEILATMRAPGSPLRSMLSADVTDPPRVPAPASIELADPAVVAAHVRNGLLRDIRGGVVPNMPDGQDESQHSGEILRVAADLVAHARGDFVLSHATAAHLHGAWTYATPALVHVTHEFHPHVARRAEPQVRRHHTRLRPSERTVVHGVPVTSPERTLVDCLRTLPAPGALVVADSLFRRGADPDEVSRIMSASRGKRGMLQARRLFDVCDPRSASPGETVARLVAIDGGLPRPECQMEVRTASATRFVDFGWPDVGLGVEFDGEIKYSGGEYGDPQDVSRNQQLRHDEIAATGVAIIRAGWRDLADPLTLGRRMTLTYYTARGARNLA